MLHCRDVAALATEYAEGNLSTRRRLALRFHLLICSGCRAFLAQLDHARAVLARLGSGAGSIANDQELLATLRAAAPKP